MRTASCCAFSRAHSDLTDRPKALSSTYSHCSSLDSFSSCVLLHQRAVPFFQSHVRTSEAATSSRNFHSQHSSLMKPLSLVCTLFPSLPLADFYRSLADTKALHSQYMMYACELFPHVMLQRRAIRHQQTSIYLHTERKLRASRISCRNYSHALLMLRS